ncbi:uncharacterized protein V1516DRAFT_676954 [Lipomyces oligophaga]|uniref:uncharacterized protein n=1 Tax=Lipomyces oligophaga TaxID=45792 RepID=UPI0034CD14E3
MISPARHSGPGNRVRVVRRAPLLSRLKAYPFDLYLQLNEELETLDWDKLATTIAFPLGVSLDALLMFSRFSARALKKESDQRAVVFADPSSLRRSPLATDVLAGQAKTGINFASWLHAFFSTLCLCLFLTSLLNTGFVFARRKKYTLFSRAADDKKMSSYSKTDSALNLESVVASEPSTPAAKVMRAFKLSGKSNEDQEFWELKVWNPSPFNLNLYTTFSPLHAYLMNTTTYTTFIRNVLLCVFVSLQTYILIRLFTQFSKDKQLLYSEMFEEYEKKVVRPKTSIIRREVAVGTDGSVEVHTPQLDRTFVTRDIRPNASSSSTPSLFATPIFVSPNKPFSTSNSPSLEAHYSAASARPRHSAVDGVRQSMRFGSSPLDSPVRRQFNQK